MKQIIEKLKEQIKFAVDNNQELNESHWGYEYGAIVTINEAQEIVNRLEKPVRQGVSSADVACGLTEQEFNNLVASIKEDVAISNDFTLEIPNKWEYMMKVTNRKIQQIQLYEDVLNGLYKHFSKPSA